MQQFLRDNILLILIFFTLLTNSVCMIKVWFSNKFFQITNPIESKEYKRSEIYSLFCFFVILTTILMGMYLIALLVNYLK